MYCVLAVTATGDENTSVCHPLAVSFVNVPVASSWPAVDQSDPTCVPVLVEALKNRMPVTHPDVAALNRTPSSTAPASPESTAAGWVTPNREQGQVVMMLVVTVEPILRLSSVARARMSRAPV